MLDRQTRPNTTVLVDGAMRLDAAAIGEWLVCALAKYRGLPIATIIPVAHGAGIAALVDGQLAFPPLDYEQPLPDELAQAYRRERDPFQITGSPALPGGLNLGSQLFWLDHLHPETMRKATVLPWAQYWAWFLAGQAVSEVTSLGCHSDLWAPGLGRFSPMAHRLGWAERFAPVARASDVVGTLRSNIAAATGLPETAEVLAGLHDSNAALLALRGYDEIVRKEATILSTGTWFVAMRIPDAHFSIGSLPQDRDCLVNVDAYGWQVPSARFMGGREIQVALDAIADSIELASDQAALLAAAQAVVEFGTMLLPTLVPGSGPFPAAVSRWINQPQDALAYRAAVCLYCALVADAALDLIGSRERLVIEGRFAQSELFVRALAAMRPGTRVYAATSEIDVSFGALRLVNPLLHSPAPLANVSHLDVNLAGYRRLWLDAIGPML